MGSISPLQTKTVLVVDDERDILEAIVEMLEHKGIKAVGFSDSEKAFEWGKSHAFDILITDLKMKKMSGILLHENLKLYHPELITVLITGFSSFESARSALTANVYVYLTKPFSMDDLMSHVTRALEKKELLDRNNHLVEEQQQLIEKLLVANKELKKLDQMKSDFVSNVSHELRTPLTSLRNIVYNLQHGVVEPLTIKQQEYIGLIEEDVTRLSALISDILDLSKLESGKERLALSSFKLSDLIGSSVKSLEESRRMKGMQILVEMEDAAKDLVIEADRSKLTQVFVNLIGNAIKYSSGGKQIRVTVGKQGQRFVVAIKDEGMGIPREDQERIFNRFEQLEKMARGAIRGSGLGLAIVKRIVEMHRGMISVESEVEKGSTFTVEMPILQSKEK